ncbi:MAG: NfeD family protein [Acidobacteria bacterium]|nr:NfeD family protein [Acidobacteriota bacterium]
MAARFIEPPFSTYVLAHLPGWTAAVIIAWVVVDFGGLPFWVGALLVATLAAKDVVSYRTMRRYYTPEPAEKRLVDYPAVAVTPLSPRGLVRVRGELWQARISSVEVVPQGALVRVRDVEGLLLIVESATESPDHCPELT